MISRRCEKSKDNTHNNLVDESIKTILTYKYTSLFYLKFFIYNILTIGFISLFTKLSQQCYLGTYCVSCDVQEAEILLILTNDKQTFLIEIYREDFNKPYKFLKDNILSKDELENQISKDSHYIGEEKHNNFPNIIFYFKNNKYIYLESTKKFRTVEMNLNLKNSEIHRYYNKGISNIKEYNYLLNKFGENIMKMKSKSYLNIILKKIFTPINLYTIFVLSIWCYEDYFNYSFVIFILSFLMLLITSYQKYSNYKKIYNYSEMSENIKIERVRNQL